MLPIPASHLETDDLQSAQLLSTFQQLLPTETLLFLVQSSPHRYYQRIFGPLVVLWSMVHQQLSLDHSCDGVLSYLTTGALDAWEAEQVTLWRGTPPQQPLSKRVPKQNASYCQARQRIPVEWLRECVHVTAQRLHDEGRQRWNWHRRSIRLLDGSTLLTQASPELIAHYGRHINQHGASHWPVLRCVASFDLYSGAVSDIVEGTQKESEQALAITLFQQAEAARAEALPDVYVADHNFGTFLVAQGAVASGQDIVVGLTQARALALLKRNHAAHPEAPGDHPEVLEPGREITLEWMASPQDQTLAKTFPEVRLSHPTPTSIRGRLIFWRWHGPGASDRELYLFTTLTDHQLYPLAEIVELYRRRWHVELNLRYLKATLELSHLQSKSLEMMRKELNACMLAYNLIRGVMLLAAVGGACSPLDLSFKRCWRRLQAIFLNWPSLLTPGEAISPGLAVSRADRLIGLFKSMGACQLYRRKKPRVCPRAVRGRPHTFPALRGERQTAKLVPA